MSAIGTSGQDLAAPHMSAFGGKADMTSDLCQFPLIIFLPAKAMR